MRGYKVKAIEGIDLSQEVPVVSFVDMQDHRFKLPCTCERLRELVVDLDTEQSVKSLNEYNISVLLYRGTIREINLEMPSSSLTAKLTGSIHGDSQGRKSVSRLDRLEPFGSTPEERQTLINLDKWRRRTAASEVMFCESCETEVPIRRVKRGQFRVETYCNKCDTKLDTTDYGAGA